MSSFSPRSRDFRKLLVADMDSTIIGQECIDELADFAGLKREVADITERAMQGKLDFKAALRERVALLSGLEEDAIARCLAERVVPNPGAATLVRTMRVGGASALLVSGGFLSFAEPVAKLIGFDRVRANRLLFDGNQLSGEVENPIIDAQAKLDALIDVRGELGLKHEDVLAIGDGANDKLMIEEAGLGVAFRAKETLVESADSKIDHHGLDALLWAQGIRKKEWVRG
jgi:phosphoserine phosphatase